MSDPLSPSPVEAESQPRGRAVIAVFELQIPLIEGETPEQAAWRVGNMLNDADVAYSRDPALAVVGG